MKILWSALSLVVVTVLAVLLWGAATGTERVEVVRDGVAVTGARGSLSSPDRSPDGSPEPAGDGRGSAAPGADPSGGPFPDGARSATSVTGGPAAPAAPPAPPAQVPVPVQPAPPVGDGDDG